MQDNSTIETAGSVPADVVATVRNVWAQVLEIDPDAIDPKTSSFFELGGYSLLALQTITWLMERYRDELQGETFELEGVLLNSLFETPTVVGQAKVLADNGLTAAPAQPSAATADRG